jgi:hypothetical protein
MRPFEALAWAVVLVGGALALGCGGSASETPFPEEPLPDYLTQKPSAAAGASTLAVPAAQQKPAPSAAAASGKPSAPGKATAPKPASAPAF